MTICAQETKVSFVGVPILEPSAPRPAGFYPNLGRWVDMVNVQCAYVTKPTLNALSTKPRYDSQLTLPIPRVLVECRAMLVAISLRARRSTKTNRARLSAFFAQSVPRPAVHEIAGLTTELPRSVPKTVCRHRGMNAALLARYYDPRFGLAGHPFLANIPSRTTIRSSAGLRTVFSIALPVEKLSALEASMRNWFHSLIIILSAIRASYFDIACRRIEAAQRQKDLFVHAPVAEDPVEARIRDMFAEPEA